MSTIYFVQTLKLGSFSTLKPFNVIYSIKNTTVYYLFIEITVKHFNSLYFIEKTNTIDFAIADCNMNINTIENSRTSLQVNSIATNVGNVILNDTIGGVVIIATNVVDKNYEKIRKCA